MGISFTEDEIKRHKSQIQMLTESGQWSKALGLIEQLMSNSPNDPDLWYQKGIALARLNRNPEAERALLEAQRIKGEDKQIESALTWVRERPQSPAQPVPPPAPAMPLAGTTPPFQPPSKPDIPSQEPGKKSDERPPRAQMPAATSLKVLNAEMTLEELKRDDRVPPEQEPRYNEILDLVRAEKFKEAVDLMDQTIKVFEDVGPRKLILSWSRAVDDLRELLVEELAPAILAGVGGTTVNAPVQITQSTALPWDPNPELVAKANNYDERGIGETYNCDVLETLNVILASDANSKNLAKACVRIYPDLVAAIWRPEPPGCIDKFAAGLSKPVLAVLGPILDLFATFFSGCGCILHFPTFLLSLLLIIPMFIMRLLMLPFVLFIQWLQRKKWEMIIRRILKDPKSPFAIRMLFNLMNILPRYWRKGDIEQIIRVNVKRFFMLRGVILLVQDHPIPLRMGCSGIIFWLFTARRRIYVLRLDKVEQADLVASKLANVLGLKVIKGKFSFNRLKLD